MAGEENDGYIIEFITIGNAVKVTAVDPASMREACIIGIANASQKQLAELAIRKLKYILHKNTGG